MNSIAAFLESEIAKTETELMGRPLRDYQVRTRVSGKLVTHVVKNAPTWVRRERDGVPRFRGPGEALAQRFGGTHSSSCLLPTATVILARHTGGGELEIVERNKVGLVSEAT